MAALGFLALLGALSAVLLTLLPLDPELTYGYTRNATATPASNPITPSDNLPYTRRNIRFDSEGTSLDAWLYTPRRQPDTISEQPFPVVIMAHGLGAQKDLGLHRFADAFASAGMAVLVFDYRTFGGSDGEPRHWVSPRRHLQDWRAALQLVKLGSLGEEYDTRKVALWGTSFAGGHVLVVGAEQPAGTVSCIMSMVPHLDGLEVSKANVRRRGLLGALRLVAAGIHDKARAAAAAALGRLGLLGPAYGNSSSHSGGSGSSGSAVSWLLAPVLGPVLRQLQQPAYIKLVGTDQEMALMQLSPEDIKSYFGKHPKVYEGGWQPRALARVALETSSYRPITSVPHLTAPVLFVAAARDGLCPPALVRDAAALLPANRSRLLELDCTHFDAYHGDMFRAASEAMVTFARAHLSLGGGQGQGHGQGRGRGQEKVGESTEGAAATA